MFVSVVVAPLCRSLVVVVVVRVLWMPRLRRINQQRPRRCKLHPPLPYCEDYVFESMFGLRDKILKALKSQLVESCKFFLYR